MKRLVSLLPLALLLLSLSGCGRADLSEARRDYLLAGPHAWLSLSLDRHAAAGDHPGCTLQASLDNEPLLSEALQASADGQLRRGWLLPVPAGKASLSVQLNDCGGSAIPASALSLDENHLLQITLSDQGLQSHDAGPWSPASLDAVQQHLDQLQADSSSALTRQQQYNKLLLGLIGLLIALQLFSLRRRAPR